MIKIPLNDIITKIKEKTSLSDQEINTKIDQKLEQLSGLISKEGAAHIIANELGIKIFEQPSGELKIKNILVGMRNVETAGKVQKTFELREFQTENRSGKVASLIIADETGPIRIVLWGDQAENIHQIKENDIIKITGGYVKENQSRKEVHLNDRSRIIINPPGITIGEVKQYANVRKKIQELNQGDESIELLGTIVQTFDPNFFNICPECNRKLEQIGEEFICKTHNKVTPATSYVLNLTLDDGSETVRCVFFKNQLERLLNKTPEEIIKYKDNPAEFEAVKTDLLGKQIKIIGRVSKNQMFDRLEFITQLVFPDPDTKQEIERLEKEKTNNTEEVKTEQEEVKTETENID